MAVTAWNRRALETARAFDGVAADYHQTNTRNPILQHMRQRALTALRRHVAPGSHLLDLGCGPGTDLAALIAAGYHITAIDASAEMVRQARHVAATLSSRRQVTVLHRRIDDLAAFAPASFDAAFSNFGPLNCVADLASVARSLHGVLRPGGMLVASVIGRVCPWEIGLYLWRGEPGRALIRFRRGHVGVPLQEGTIWTRYFTPREFARIVADAGFTPCSLASMGVLAPPPYLEAFATRRPRLASFLLSADACVSTWPVIRQIGDHFVVAMRRN